MEAASDKEFKARCLFMMARCSQKQVRKPQYLDFGYNNYDAYDKSTDEYYLRFMKNEYYPILQKEYGHTKFYKEVSTRCSYLSDFVRTH